MQLSHAPKRFEVTNFFFISVPKLPKFISCLYAPGSKNYCAKPFGSPEENYSRKTLCDLASRFD